MFSYQIVRNALNGSHFYDFYVTVSSLTEDRETELCLKLIVLSLKIQEQGLSLLIVVL